MMMLGVGEITGGILQGKVIDHKGGRVGLLVVMGVLVATIAFTVIAHTIQEYNAFWFFTAFGWGLLDSCANTSANSICSSQFDSDIEPFAIFKFIQSFFV